MVRWLERNGYDVSYITGVDTDRRGARAPRTQGFLSVGHDEYWSGQQRANVEAARDAGVNLAFFSGNEVFWKTRWETSIDGSQHAVPHAGHLQGDARQREDRPEPDVWTGTWRDPRFSRRPTAAQPENALTGTIFTVNALRATIRSSSRPTYGKLRFWRNTERRAAQAAGQPRRSATARSATSGTRTSTTASGRPAWCACRRRPRRRGDVPAGLRHHLRRRHGHARLTLYRAAERRAGLRRRHGPVVVGSRRESRHRDGRPARARQSTNIRIGDDLKGPVPAIRRRRSTCSPTWACSRRRCNRGS